MHLVSRHDQSTCMNYNLLFSGAWQIWLHGFEPANFFFFFLSLVYARVLVNQFFFFPLFFFWFVFGFRHDLAYFKEDHSKSKVLGCNDHLTFQFMSLRHANESMGKQTVSLHAPKRSDIEAKWSTYNQYTLEERAKMGRRGAEGNLSKVTGHFSLLLIGKLTCV